MIKDPPIRDNTIDNNNRFFQTWIKWFQSIKTIINDYIFATDARLDEIESLHGWGYYQDNQYTSGSPLNINNTTTQVTINGLGASTNTTFLPTGTSFFDTSTSEITPDETGVAFIMRFDFKAKSATNNVSFDLLIDIGNPSPLYDNVYNVSKGINTEQRYSISIPIYCLATFVANGGKIKLRTTNNIDFYDFGLFIARINKP